jgi:large subunit ribosomal protein L22
MESRAILSFNGLTARKMRQVADLVRGKDVDVALHTLRFVTKAAAKPMEKLITSAVANAREKANASDARFDADAFFVKTVMVDEGPTMKRFRPRAQGRAYSIFKRSCHVKVVLDERPRKAQPKAGSAKAAAAGTDKADKAGKADKAAKSTKSAAVKTAAGAKSAKTPKKAAAK